MKVIHLISGGDVGGAKTHVLSLLRALGRERVSLICFRDGEFAQDARALGIDVRICDKSISGCISELSRIISAEGFQIVHCHGSRANFIGSLLKRKTGVPFVTTVHSDYKLDYLGRPLAALTYGKLNAHALRKMDYYIGVSDAMCDILKDRDFPPEKIYTIYNGIDFSAQKHPLTRCEFFRGYGIEASDKWIIAGIAARLNPVKDIPTLIKAAAQAVKSCPELHIAIAGDGEQLSMLRALADELGIAQNVHFLGWVDDMDSFYSAIDIITLTSLSETFPYALTEGTRFCLPAISSRVGGVSKLLDGGRCGRLFSPGDNKALAEFLIELSTDKEKRHALGKALEKRSHELFSIEKTRDTQIEIYKSILRREARKRAGERYGITLCGAYGQKNTGDDAILESIVRSLHGYDPDIPITIMSRTPKETAKSNRVRSILTFNPTAYRKSMRSSKLFIAGGGSLIQNATSHRSLWFYLHVLKSAKKLGCKVMMYGCGIGPVTGDKDRARAAKILNNYVDTITLREDSSLGELESLGVNRPKIVLSADPAITIPCPDEPETDAIIASAGLESDGRYIGFALRPWQGFSEKVNAIAAAADYACEKYSLTPVFITINAAEDIRPSELVCSKIKTPHIMLAPMDSSYEITAVLSRMRVLVSMRLHGLILASGRAVPLVGLSYDPKVDAFMKYMRLNNVLQFEDISAQSLITAVDSAYAADTSAQNKNVQRLMELETVNLACAKELIES